MNIAAEFDSHPFRSSNIHVFQINRSYIYETIQKICIKSVIGGGFVSRTATQDWMEPMICSLFLRHGICLSRGICIPKEYAAQK